MHPVLCLWKDDGVRTVDDLVGNLLPSVGGEAVHHHHIRVRSRDERGIHLIGRENPRPQNAKRLKGRTDYSLRVGVYRILYDIEDESKVVTVYRVKHRQDAYR